MNYYAHGLEHILLNILILPILIFKLNVIPFRIAVRFSIVIDKHSKNYMDK